MSIFYPTNDEMIDTEKPQRIEKGILIIALSNNYYGKMAYNLLVSIKAQYNIPIALVYDQSGISHLFGHQLDFFDHRIECPVEYKTANGKLDALKPKLYLDKLTPFTHTLFLDADTIWNPHKNPDNLFKELDGKDFMIANRGYDSNLSMWVDIPKIKQKFGISRFLDISSEVIYFEKPDVFEKAREVAEKDFPHRKHGTSMPDEPCFAIALELLKKDIPLWKPSYWYFANPKTNVSRTTIQENYYIVSAGGAFFDRPSNSGGGKVKQLYDDYAKYSFNIVKQTPFELQQKSKVIPERKSF